MKTSALLLVLFLLPCLTFSQNRNNEMTMLFAKKTKKNNKECIQQYRPGNYLWIRSLQDKNKLRQGKIKEVNDSVIVIHKDTLRIAEITYLKKKGPHMFLFSGIGMTAGTLFLLSAIHQPYFFPVGWLLAITSFASYSTGLFFTLTGTMIELTSPVFKKNKGARFYTEKRPCEVFKKT